MTERRNEITVIVGRKGSGKSTRARELLARASRRVIVDPMWEHTQGVIVKDFASLVSYIRPLRASSYAAVLRARNELDVMQTIGLTVAGEPESPPLPGCTLCVDELDKLCSPSTLPVELHDVVNYGRHYRVSLIGLARRPNKLHRDITANADRIVIGQTLEPRDVDYLTEFIGETLAARAKRLRRWEFVVWPDDLETDSRDDAAGETRDDADEDEAEHPDSADVPCATVPSQGGDGAARVPVALGDDPGGAATRGVSRDA